MKLWHTVLWKTQDHYYVLKKKEPAAGGKKNLRIKTRILCKLSKIV